MLVMSACRPKFRRWGIFKSSAAVDCEQTEAMRIAVLAAVAVHVQKEFKLRISQDTYDYTHRDKLLKSLQKSLPELMHWTKSESDLPEYWMKQLVRRISSILVMATEVRSCCTYS